MINTAPPLNKGINKDIDHVNNDKLLIRDNDDL